VAIDLEILKTGRESPGGTELLDSMVAAIERSDVSISVTNSYWGHARWLMLYGVGAADRAAARDAQLRNGGHALLWDLGYFGRAKRGGYMRVSIDHQHPQAWLDRTTPRGERWEAHGIALSERFDASGHIVLVGCGVKSHRFLGTHGWEQRKLNELRQRFPATRIIYRPKPGSRGPNLDCDTDASSSAESLLACASLVVCRHSNFAVDAIVAGVPFECEDGAAAWIKGKPITKESRLDFLRRLCWWQWKATEADQFWKFFREIAISEDQRGRWQADTPRLVELRHTTRPRCISAS
jgi:hypothetical protein